MDHKNPVSGIGDGIFVLGYPDELNRFAEFKIAT